MSKYLIPIFSVILLFGCKKNTSLSLEDSFPGYYKADKITSSTAVDLNNDGLKSNDIYFEISSPFTDLNGQQISFYNFETIGNYIEVRSLPNQINRSKLIAFNFPHQIIDYLSNNSPFLVIYNNEFLNYTYEISNNNTLQVHSANPEYSNQIGKISSLILKENGDLIVLLKKQIFDFVDKTWQQIDITAEYSKVP